MYETPTTAFIPLPHFAPTPLPPFRGLPLSVWLTPLPYILLTKLQQNHLYTALVNIFWTQNYKNYSVTA